MIEVGAKLTVDASLAGKSIQDLQTELKDAKKALNEAKIGTQEYADAHAKLTQATANLNKVTGESSSAFGTLKERLSSSVPGFKAAEEGGKSFLTTLKALAVNPFVVVITLVVAGLMALYKAFTSTKDGADKVEFVLHALGKVMDELRDRVLAIGGALVKFFTGDFKGAFEDGKKAITGIGSSLKETYSAAYKVAEGLDRVKDALADMSMTEATLNRKLAEAKEMLYDENASYKDKKNAIKELKDQELPFYDQKAKLLKENLDLIRQDNKAQKDRGTLSEEQIQKERDAYIAAENAQTEAASKRRQTLRTELTIERQEKAKLAQQEADALKRQKELDEKRKEEAEKLKEALKLIQDAEDKQGEEDRKYQIEKLRREYQERADIVTKQGLSTMQIWKAFDTERKTLETKWKKEDDEKEKERKEKQIAEAKDLFARQQEMINKEIAEKKAASDAKKEIDQKEKEAKEALQQSELAAMDAIADMMGKNTAAGKAMAVAATTISTYSAAQKAYESQQIPGDPSSPIRGAIAAAAAVVQGLARVKGILSVQVPRGGGGGGSVPGAPSTPSPLVPRAQAAQTSVISQSSLSQINATASRAFVVESDIDNNRQRISRINRAARLG